MQYIIFILVVLGLLFIKSCIDNKRIENRIKEKLNAQWGQVPIQEYSYEKFSSISKFYEMNREPSTDVDDITWNDLNMDEVFMLLNHTESSIGEEYLYSILRKLKFDKEILEERNRMVVFFQEQKEARIEVQKRIALMGKLKDISFYEYVNRMDSVPLGKPWLHYLCAGGLMLSLLSLLIPIYDYYSFIAIAGFCILNVLTYYRRKAKIEMFFYVISYILRSVAQIEQLSQVKIPELEGYFNELKILVKDFNRFRRNSGLVVSKNPAGSFEDAILDYIRMLFHVDLIKFDSMVGILQSKKDRLNRMFEIVGILDSMIAIASFRELFKDEYCIPVLHRSKNLSLTAEEVYHPLIIDAVKNSIDTDKSVLLTGSNASGKSTFIKTLAINAIFAQTIFTCLSKYYCSNYFKVFSSMALRDDIMSQESYYIVEIKSLKRIYDQSGAKVPLLCFVDEVLRGTNTAERIGASSQILKCLSSRNTLCFAATHDIELTYILEKYYKNYHFEEQIKEDNVVFDYLLHKGRATSRNAIRLLGMMGYDNGIIEAAMEEVNQFLITNKWNVL